MPPRTRQPEPENPAPVPPTQRPKPTAPPPQIVRSTRVPRATTTLDPWDGVTAELVFADLFSCAPHWSIPAEQAAHSGLFLIWKGQGWVEINGDRFPATPGDLFFTRPGSTVAAGHDPARPLTVLSTGFQLHSRAGADPLRRLALPCRLRLPPAARREFLAAFSELVAEFADPAPAAHLAARGCALRLLAMALRLVDSLPAAAQAGLLAGRPGDAGRITQVLEYIDAHLAADLDLAKLAAVAHLSAVHFATVFRREIGRPPMHYVLERRIERARALLSAGDATVEQIARAVGFLDPYHFSRTFRRQTGRPPTAYRAALKNPFQP